MTHLHIDRCLPVGSHNYLLAASYCLLTRSARRHSKSTSSAAAAASSSSTASVSRLVEESCTQVGKWIAEQSKLAAVSTGFSNSVFLSVMIFPIFSLNSMAVNIHQLSLSAATLSSTHCYANKPSSVLLELIRGMLRKE